jgi:predicted nuclease with TOPRIM domain
MPANGNETMLERLERIESRLDGVDVRLDRVETKVDRLEKRLETFESHVDTRFGRVEVQLEDIRETLTKFTGTFGASLDTLTREIVESRKEYAARSLDHHRVLTNHNQRITALERRPKRRA